MGANLSLLLEDVIWDDEENFRTTRVREGIHFVAGDHEFVAIAVGFELFSLLTPLCIILYSVVELRICGICQLAMQGDNRS